MDINMITVSGNVAKSPTSTKNGDVLYANFSLTVNVGTHEAPKTIWYSVSASGKNAEIILNHVNPGDKLFIIGKPSVDIYLGKDKQVVGVQKIWLERFEYGSSKTVAVEHIAPITADLLDNKISASLESQALTINTEYKPF